MKVSEYMKIAQSYEEGPEEKERGNPPPAKGIPLLDLIPDSLFRPLTALGWKVSRHTHIAEPEILVKDPKKLDPADPVLIIRVNPGQDKYNVVAWWPAAWGNLGVSSARESKPVGRITWKTFNFEQTVPATKPKAGAQKVTVLCRKLVPALAKGVKKAK